MDEQSREFASQNSADPAPLATLVEKEQAIPEPVAVVHDEPTTAKQRLRAFEDEHFGEDAVRVNGEIERGRGSPFADMDDDKRRQYDAIELLIAAEQRLDDSTAALASAEADHQAALAALAALEANASS